VTKTKEQRWYEAMVAKGHEPVMFDGELDYFVYDNDMHNGPGCSTCGWSDCWHCNHSMNIPECIGR
jgi:hypothetical protein